MATVNMNQTFAAGKTDATMTNARTAILLTEAANLLFDARTVLDLQSEIHGDYFPAKLEAARESLEVAERAYELSLAECEDVVGGGGRRP